MKIKNIIALLAAVSLLTACGKVSIESKTEIQTHDASVSAEENSDNEKATIPSDYDGAEYWDADGNPITLADTEESTAEISEVDDEMQYEACSVRPQCAPSFGVDFELPYDWSYETSQTDDDPTSSISIYLKPDAEADGRITLEYTKGGIVFCGTGLHQENIDFNGCSAVKGTYDNSDKWDFILLNDEFEGCAVLNNANDWYDKYADEIEYILSTVEFMKYETSESHDSIMKYEACSVRPQCAPSFGIDFELPYDWSYETVQTDDDPTSSISVCLKPNTEADGSIILEYTKGGIEVSNSALSEIETEFNGYPATEGTYLCSEQWDHIFLKGDYEGCAVLNNANDWYDKYADEIEYILSTVEFRKYD